MSINLTMPETQVPSELKPRITVVGVGGAGGNAINNMINRELGGVEFLAMNTDAQALSQSKAEHRIQLGAHLTKGLGAGAKPEIGRAAAEEAIDEVLGELTDVHMAFIAAGMGGGTGTGAAPVIAGAAREAGILTVGVVTKPFQFEGSHRMALAEEGILELEKVVDTLIIIPNQNLFRIANESTTFADAFGMADQVLYSGVRGVTDLIVMPGLINLDFADIRSVMSEMGKAMMGTGEAEGERRALDAAEAAINNPLLEDTSMKGAKGVLINITGSEDITLFEVDEAATRIRSEIDGDARIIVGSAFDSDLKGKMRVSVVATGIDVDSSRVPQPSTLSFPEMEEKNEGLSGISANSKDGMGVENNNGEVDHISFELDAEPMETGNDRVEDKHSIDKSLSPTVSGASDVSSELSTHDNQEELEIDSDKSIPELDSVGEEKKIFATSSVDTLNTFIPPKPVLADKQTSETEPNPFRAADLANGSNSQDNDHEETVETSIRPSLFELVTRTGRAALRKSNENREENKPVGQSSYEQETIVDSQEVEKIDDNLRVADIKPYSQVEEEQTEMEELVSSPDGYEDNKDNEDLLDIPAFLRRQAN